MKIKNYKLFNEELDSTFHLLLMGSSAITLIAVLVSRLQNSNNVNKIVQSRVEFDQKLKEIAIKVGSDQRLVEFLQRYRENSDVKMTLSEMEQFKLSLRELLSQILTVDESSYLIELIDDISKEFGGNEKKNYNCGICRGAFLAFPSQQRVICPHCKRTNILT